MRILFVENHEAFATTVTREFLSDHDVVIAPTIASARAKISASSFDAVLVDYDLDDGKGDAFVRWLLERQFRGPIVAVSSHEAGNDALQAAGASARCPKTRFTSISEVLAAARRTS